MYIEKDKFFSEPFKSLRRGKEVGYSFPAKGNRTEISEFDINIEDMSINGEFLIWGGGYFAQMKLSNGTYESYKSAIVKKRYSLDDQIAIILNKGDSESDSIDFQRMQEWRSYASVVARKIMEVIEAEKTKL